MAEGNPGELAALGRGRHILQCVVLFFFNLFHADPGEDESRMPGNRVDRVVGFGFKIGHDIYSNTK